MHLRIRVFASFREAIGSGSLQWTAPDGATVAEVVALLKAAYPGLGPAAEKALLAVNQEYVGSDFHLHDGDELALIPPVSGG